MSPEPPRLTGRRVVVTGGAGFIGRHVVRRCLAAGADRIVVLDRRPPGDEVADNSIETVSLDLARAKVADLADALRGASDLIHLAAEKHNLAKDRPADVYRTNVLGTHALFAAARIVGLRRVVFASSLYAYGRTSGGPMREDEEPRPRTAYGISKLSGEQALLDLCAQTATRGASLRYFFVYGQGQAESEGYHSLIPKTLARIRRGEAPLVHGDGKQALDYVHVDDVARATLAALDGGLAGDVVNVGSGTATRVCDLVRAVVELTGAPVRIEHGPADDTAESCRFADIALARERLGWSPRLSLEEGLRQLVHADA